MTHDFDVIVPRSLGPKGGDNFELISDTLDVGIIIDGVKIF